jgi:hypothetical protein
VAGHGWRVGLARRHRVDDAGDVSRTARWVVIVLAGLVTLTVLAIAPSQAPPAPSAAGSAGSGAPGSESSSAASDDPPEAVTRTPEQATTVVGGGAADQALAISRALWQSSLVAVVADAEDPAAIESAGRTAISLSAPLLLGSTALAADAAPTEPDADLAAELDRLGVQTAVGVGDAPPALPDAIPVSADPADVQPQEPTGSLDVVVLATPDPVSRAARATAEAAGAQVVVIDGTDPRADPDAIAALSASPRATVLALGDGFGSAERVSRLAAVAATGVQLPGGGQTLFPGRRLVALYGHPQTGSLGVLGEQGPEESVAKARDLAATYQPFSDVPVVPAFEIIATTASEFPGPDGNYSNESTLDVLRPYVDAAAAAGVYVVLDLQPGRSDFLTQAQRYAELLALPHVGLALDPEWRLAPDQVHLRQIGTVDAAEVSAVADWLAGFVSQRALPQKLLLLHQFQQRMITNRQTLSTQRDELAVLVQMDGDGPPGDKLATWEALKQDAQPGLLFGWKNFYDEDEPTFSPEQTMSVQPVPWWVSYQ